LRFNGSCVRFLWVFKFFFGFLQVRRSAWNYALHSFHSALGESETSFFGVSRKRRREKGGKSTPFFAVGGFCRGRVCQQGGPVQLTTSASHTYWASPLSRNTYTAFLTAATARHQASVPGVGGATTPLTTSTAPISAKRSGLRRVRSSVRRKSPTLLCLHRYAATASINLSIKRRGGAVRAGWRHALGVRPVWVCMGTGPGLYF